MHLKRFLKARWLFFQQGRAKKAVLRASFSQELSIARADWPQSLQDPSEFYLRCFRFFHAGLSEDLKNHRKYFSKNRRGFGEDAFHTMWFLLFREFQPVNFLEIGVYRGQVLSLASLLQQKYGRGGQVTGISPFLPAGDSVSSYREDVKYLEDTQVNFEHFSLPKPRLLKAFSTEQSAVELISSQKWDCIYIDGNHDYEVAKADWKLCSEQVSKGGLIVLDDSGLTTTYRPALFSTAGHPGPSKLAEEINRAEFREILQVGHNRVFQSIKK